MTSQLSIPLITSIIDDVATIDTADHKRHWWRHKNSHDSYDTFDCQKSSLHSTYPCVKLVLSTIRPILLAFALVSLQTHSYYSFVEKFVLTFWNIHYMQKSDPLPQFKCPLNSIILQKSIRDQYLASLLDLRLSNSFFPSLNVAVTSVMQHVTAYFCKFEGQ